MGDRQYIAAGFFLIRSQPFPQVAGVRAAVRRVRGIGNHLRCPVRVVTIDNYPMHIVAGYERGPLVADESRKLSGIVIFFAASIVRCQTDLYGAVSGQYIIDAGKLPFANKPIIS